MKENVKKEMVIINLIKVIEQIKNDINELKFEKTKEIAEITDMYNIKIRELETALQVNMKLNTACLECKGRGTMVYCGASGNTERGVCNACNGSGVRPNLFES